MPNGCKLAKCFHVLLSGVALNYMAAFTCIFFLYFSAEFLRILDNQLHVVLAVHQPIGGFGKDGIIQQQNPIVCGYWKSCWA